MQLESFSHAVARLAERGFSHTLVAANGRVRDVATGEFHDPGHLTIDEIVRFEGESDPDEQAVLFALRTARGEPLGTYSTVFGPTMPPEDVSIVRRLGAKR